MGCVVTGSSLVLLLPQLTNAHGLTRAAPVLLQEALPQAQVGQLEGWFQEAIGIRCLLTRQQAGSRTATLSTDRSFSQLEKVPPQQTQLSQDPQTLPLRDTEASPSNMPPLSRSRTEARPEGAQDRSSSLGFANEAQLLLLNAASLALVDQKLLDKTEQTLAGAALPTEVSRFRANVLVGSPQLPPFAEDSWEEVCLGRQRFSVAGESIVQHLRVQASRDRFASGQDVLYPFQE